jgi:beta-galactosidase
MIQVGFNENWIFCRQGETSAVNVTLPHDAMIGEKRRPDCESGSAGAYFPGGIYQYTKTFVAEQEWHGKQILIEFEGVYQNAVISINGTEIGQIVYGYTGAHFDISGVLEYGKENTITVTVDNQQIPNSRWYSGAGIYRPVTLYILDSVRINFQGIKITTKSVKPAVVHVETEHQGGTVQVSLRDHEGTLVAEKTGDSVDLEVPNAKLWSDENPYLYMCRVQLQEDGKIADSREIPVGIRSLHWSSQGFFVNGKQTLLRGGCVHHDNGVLGACAYAEAEERKVRILKETGFNAIRSAHNPCSRALLDACDRYGIYVMDETWDMWYCHKSKYDYAAHFKDYYKNDIRAMVAKDYNHPSVVFYSIGNEVSEPSTKEGLDLAKEMISYLHELDDSRAVTAGINLMIVANAAKGKQMYKEDGGVNSNGDKMSGMNSTMFNMIAQMVGSGMNKSANGEKADKATTPILDALDIAGYNYASGRYGLEGKKHPARVIYGSETFPQDIGKNWAMVEKYPYLIGDFMWTAFDYLGEAGLGAWSYSADAKGFNKPYPWLLGGAGVIDILGNPDGEALYAKAVWGQNQQIGIAVCPPNHPTEKVIKSSWRGTNAIPSWSWRGCNGNKTTVEVYTKGRMVELFLNGRKAGRKKTKDCKCIFKVKYEAGTLEAVSFNDAGQELERGRLMSADGKLGLSISPEKKSVKAGEVFFVPINICGENGVVECNADEAIQVSVEGGTLLGFGSANPRTEESYLAGQFTAYAGRTLAVIRAEQSGEIMITAQSKKLGVAKAQIECE